MTCFKTRFHLLITLSVLVDCCLAFGQKIPDGRFVDPQPVPGIEFNQQNRLEAVPTISQDGLEMFFISDNGIHFGIYRSIRESVDQPFERPKLLRDISNFTSDDVGTSLTADGLSLYFHSNRGGEQGQGLVDIYRAKRPSLGEPFDEIEKLPSGINTSLLEAGATVTKDGQTLFFHRRGPRGTASDLFMATDEGAGFEEVVSLDQVNDGYDNVFPSPSADGLFLFFSDFDSFRGNGLHPDDYVRPDGYGSEDLWVTHRASSDHPFGEPVNVNDLWPNSEVNSEARDVTPRVSPDWPNAGSKLYWTTGYRSGDDLMVATWLPRLTGDFNSNGELDAADIDLLSTEIVGNANKIAFDLNTDGKVDLLDHSAWIELNKTLAGDANLDGLVNFEDFLSLSENFGQAGGWGQGDFNADLLIQFGDFLLLSESFGTSPNNPVTAPEPHGLALTACGVLGMLGFRRRRRFRLGPRSPRGSTLEQMESRQILTVVGFATHNVDVSPTAPATE